MSGIQLRCKVFPLSFLLYLVKPRCSIDGGPEQKLKWGENMLPGPPGRHSLRVWFPWIFGPANVANADLDVPPQGVAMVYKTRWNVFVAGMLEPLDPSYAQYGQYGYVQYGQQPGPGWAPQQSVPAQPAAAPAAAWHADPSGRHQHRWWDGSQWTSAVADNGVTSDDPL